MKLTSLCNKDFVARDECKDLDELQGQLGITIPAEHIGVGDLKMGGCQVFCRCTKQRYEELAATRLDDSEEGSASPEHGALEVLGGISRGKSEKESRNPKCYKCPCCVGAKEKGQLRNHLAAATHCLVFNIVFLEAGGVTRPCIWYGAPTNMSKRVKAALDSVRRAKDRALPAAT